MIVTFMTPSSLDNGERMLNAEHIRIAYKGITGEHKHCMLSSDDHQMSFYLL